jgi:2-isopropylmalate synthase
MALHTRRDFFNLETNVKTEEIYPTSRLIASRTGMDVQANKAIVGANAFRHSSGLHTDGILKDRTTFEIISPEIIGQTTAPLVLGKTSGRHAVRNELEKLGLEVGDAEFPQIFQAYKEIAERKRVITGEDLRSIVSDVRRTATEVIHLERLEYSGSEPSDFRPRARIKLSWVDERGRSKLKEAAAFGDGPGDAVCSAIDRATRSLIKQPIHLADFRIVALSPGTEALGDVTIRIESNDSIYTGRGSSTDVVVASARAYLNALNQMLSSPANE